MGYRSKSFKGDIGKMNIGIFIREGAGGRYWGSEGGENNIKEVWESYKGMYYFMLI